MEVRGRMVLKRASGRGPLIILFSYIGLRAVCTLRERHAIPAGDIPRRGVIWSLQYFVPCWYIAIALG